MSGAETCNVLGPIDDTTERFDRVIVVGGGCYGRYYVRQLQRAARAGVINAEKLVVVDRDARCAVAVEAMTGDHEPWPLAVEIREEEWREFFSRYLTVASQRRSIGDGDAIVPSPLMPHLMAEWLVGRARERWPTREVATGGLERAPDLPWERPGPDATHYVSFANWTCPINCVEPRTCPHTRGPRNWSLPEWLPTFARSTAPRDSRRAVVALHCRHRAYGVGMFDTAEVIAGDDAIVALGEGGGGEALIGTLSHCHGAVTRLVIGPPNVGADSPVG